MVQASNTYNWNLMHFPDFCLSKKTSKMVIIRLYICKKFKTGSQKNNNNSKYTISVIISTSNNAIIIITFFQAILIILRKKIITDSIIQINSFLLNFLKKLSWNFCVSSNITLYYNFLKYKGLKCIYTMHRFPVNILNLSLIYYIKLCPWNV